MHATSPARALLAAALLAVAILAAAPAAADVLVTRDGQRVETRGAWEVKGRLVVFTTADGQLASLRADDVDLEASRRVTAAGREPEAREAAEPAEADRETPQRRSSGRRITNADIAPGEGPLPAPPAAEEEGAEGDEEVGEGEMRRELAVLGIERVTAPDGHAVVRGTLRNTADEPALGVSLTIHLHDVDGSPSGSARAELGSRALQAGEETPFEAHFPDVYVYESLRLEPRATFIATGGNGADDGSQGGSEDGAGDDGAGDAS